MKFLFGMNINFEAYYFAKIQKRTFFFPIFLKRLNFVICECEEQMNEWKHWGSNFTIVLTKSTLVISPFQLPQVALLVRFHQLTSFTQRTPLFSVNLLLTTICGIQN